MPIIAKFHGLTIKMYFQQREHNPPHFRVLFGDRMGVFNIYTLEMLEGDLPKKEIALIQRWGIEHRAELLQIWNTQKFTKIMPLQ